MRFEIPTDIAKSLTDAGHTAVGFATLAAKRANDARLDANARFEPQLVEVRSRALELVETLDTARVRVETTVDPIVERAVERLPENLQDAVAEYRKMGKELASKAHDGAVRAIEFATAVPVSAPAKKSAASVAETAAAATPKVRRAPKATPAAAKKTTARSAKTSAKAPAKGSARTATKAAAKPAARRTRTAA